MPKQRKATNASLARKPRHKFTLFIANPSRHLDSALARLRNICDDNIPADYEIEVIDLSQNPHLASEHQILATPTVLRTLPEPLQRIIGDLSDRDKALLGLLTTPV